MTDKKISELTQITGSDVDDANDEIAIVDASTSETKAITREELFKDIDGDITLSGTVDGRDVAADGSKLDGIEANATADQTAGEIKTAYESNADTNAFTDAEKSKLSGIESGAEVNTVDSVNTQTGSVVLDADDIDDSATTNKFTTAAEISKLDGIEANADVTDTANVEAAGAVMDSELTDEAAVKALDQGVATTDSPEFDVVTATSFVGDGSSLTGLPSGYTDTDVDTHLNQNTATADQVLTWDGSDYAWEDASSGVTQSTADWEAGTSTTEGIVSPAKNKAAFDAFEQQIGVGQTWQDVSGSRVINTSYQNTTGRPIAVSANTDSFDTDLEVSTDNSSWVQVLSQSRAVSGVVPDQFYYRVSSGGSLDLWVELR